MDQAQRLRRLAELAVRVGVNVQSGQLVVVNGTVESVSMGAGSTGLTLNVSGLGSVPYSSVNQISN